MKLPFLPGLSSPTNHSPYQLVLAASLLLGFAPLAAQAQSVTFAGAVTALPTDNLNYASWLVIDDAGDLIIQDPEYDRIVELPRTATGFGPQMTLPLGDLAAPDLLAVDGAGDVFIHYYRDNLVAEYPKTSTGYGPRTIVYDGGPYTGTTLIDGLVADSAGNLFLAEGAPSSEVAPPPLVEVPRTATGYGPPISYDFSIYNSPTAIALDSAGNVFIADYKDQGSSAGGRVRELQKTGAGYGSPMTLIEEVPYTFGPMTIDSSGNLFTSIVPIFFFPLDLDVAKFPRTLAGFGPPVILPYFGVNDSAQGLAADHMGNLYASTGPADGNSHGLITTTVKMQFDSVAVGNANICPPDATHPWPCHQRTVLYYNVNADQTLGTPRVLTGGKPDLDFNLEEPSNCTGSDKIGTFCEVKVAFTPLAPGVRNGEVQIIDGGGNVVTTTPLTGTGTAIGTTPQTIDFTRLSAQTAGTNVPLAASASSGLPVTYTSSPQLICSINGSTIILLGSGTCEVKAIQAGNAEYYPASRRQSFFVHHARQTIDFPTISPQVAGTVLDPEVTASSGLSIAFTSTTENVCIVPNYAKNTTKLIAEGTCTLRAKQAGNAKYYPAEPVDQSFHVSSAP